MDIFGDKRSVYLPTNCVPREGPESWPPDQDSEKSIKEEKEGSLKGPEGQASGAEGPPGSRHRSETRHHTDLSGRETERRHPASPPRFPAQLPGVMQDAGRGSTSAIEARNRNKTGAAESGGPGGGHGSACGGGGLGSGAAVGAARRSSCRAVTVSWSP